MVSQWVKMVILEWCNESITVPLCPQKLMYHNG